MPSPEVRYCTSEDGVRIAYSVEGEGPPLIALPAFFESFAHEHVMPGRTDALRVMARGHRLVFMDSRGTGLSDKNLSDVSIAGFRRDVDAVVRVLDAESVSLLGSLTGGIVALDYAACHPDKVDRLVLHTTFARIRDVFSGELLQSIASLARSNWELAARTLADLGARREEGEERGLLAAEWIRRSMTGEFVARMVEANADLNLKPNLSLVQAATLILHPVDDDVYPLALGQELATAIPNARLVPTRYAGYAYESLPQDVLLTINAFLSEGLPSPQPARTDDPSTMAAPAAQPQSFTSGRYAVQRLLGEGGQKTVFLARDTQLGRDVAVALLKAEGIDDASLARLRREAQALARLEAQPNIVAIYDIGEHEGRPFTVCEYLAGGTLEQELARAGGALPAERAVAIARDVCRALIVAHGGDIIHRDIKPSNIWLTASGNAKLGDFGLATALGRSHLTQAGTIMGTAAYMAPEQALGREADQRSDIYALGCVLYEMPTGRPPFLGDTAVAVVAQHINASPVAASQLQADLPPALERIVLRMLAKAPEDRPQTAAEVLAALDGSALGQGLPVLGQG